MRIALCFAGQPRFINLMNFGNLTDGHDVTTYAHFWWDDEYRGDMLLGIVNSNIQMIMTPLIILNKE